MNKILLFCISLLLITSCSSSNNGDVESLNEFLSGVIEIDSSDAKNSQLIAEVQKLAQQKADKTIQINKSNIKESLEEAQKYNVALITVGKHTIVKIIDFDNCKLSSSWNNKMPLGEALIRKDGIVRKTDYINNIIGTPDSQARTMYLFN